MRALCLAVFAFLLAPILVMVPLSFSESSFLAYPIHGWSLKWYQHLFESPEWARATRNSFIVAPAATLVATVLGTLAAVGLSRADFRFKGLLMGILIAPMVVPIIVVGVATYLYFAPLGLADSYFGLIVVHAALGAPFVLTTVLATLAGFNHNLVRASLSLGETPLNTFFRITLPVIAPGVISGALFAFATSFDEVVVTLTDGREFSAQPKGESQVSHELVTLCRSALGVPRALPSPPITNVSSSTQTAAEFAARAVCITCAATRPIAKKQSPTAPAAMPETRHPIGA